MVRKVQSRRVCGQEGVIVARQPWLFRNASGACKAPGREGCRDGLIEERVDAVGGPTWERQQSNRADNKRKRLCVMMAHTIAFERVGSKMSAH
jgi:hypothetical protein